MKLSDLKTGMHVITRNGDEYVVMRDVVTHADGQTGTSPIIMTNIKYCAWLNLKEYAEDLTLYDNEFGIQKVYMPRYYRSLVTSVEIKPEDFVLIWKRPTKKQMTLEEIEEALGYEVEIVE